MDIESMLERSKKEPVEHRELGALPRKLSTLETEKVKKTLHDHLFAVCVNLLCGLYCLLHVPSVARVLEATKATGNPYGAFKRYYYTTMHVIQWFNRPEDYHKSVRAIRGIHLNAFKHSLAKGLDVTQYEMILTQWAFVGPIVLFPDRSGLASMSCSQKMRYLELMFNIGKDMGVKNEYNICLGSYEEVKFRCHEVLRLAIRPWMRSKGPHTQADVMLEGIHILTPALDPEAFKVWTRNLVCEERLTPKGCWSKFIHWLVKMCLGWMLYWDVGPFRWFMNLLMRQNLWAANPKREPITLKKILHSVWIQVNPSCLYDVSKSLCPTIPKEFKFQICLKK